jgi:hypothetical protein
MFVVDIVYADRMEFVPEIQNPCYYDGDPHANRKENSISGKQDEQSHYGANGNEKCCASLQRKSDPWRIRHHADYCNAV